MSYPGTLRRMWVDGMDVDPRSAVLPLGEGGLLSGLGLFETLALRDGVAIDLERHLRRIENSGLQLGIALPSLSAVRAIVETAATESVDGLGWLKLVVTAGGPWIVLAGKMEDGVEGGEVHAVVLPWRRDPRGPTTGLKTLSYGANLLGLREARRRGADEGLWLNTRGRLAEGCTSNLFVVRSRRLLTPALREGVLPGIVREHVLEAARALGLQATEGRLRLRQLQRATEAFLTSSLRGVRPLIRVDGRPVGPGRPGPVARRIAREVAASRAREAAQGPRLDSGGAGPEV